LPGICRRKPGDKEESRVNRLTKPLNQEKNEKYHDRYAIR